MKTERATEIPGSAGCQPAIVGSLPTILNASCKFCSMSTQNVLGRLPSTTGWQPVFPSPIKSVLS